MYSSSSNQNYFFIGVVLFLIFMGSLFYGFNMRGDTSRLIFKIIIGIVSFLVNLFIIGAVDILKKRRALALGIYILLSVSTTQIFGNINTGLSYFLLSLVLMFLLDIIPSISKFKYFNAGLLTTFAAFLYLPITFIVLFFFLAVIIFYEKRINIFQYIMGVIVAVILIIEISFLLDRFYWVLSWLDNFRIPRFEYEYQVPALLLLGFILVYGLINQYSGKYSIQELDVNNKYSIVIFYLLFWMIIFAFFMGTNYGLLAFVSIPVTLIVSRTL